MQRIPSFHGEYRFLSNFWPARVGFGAYQFPTVEHAYQAAKCKSHNEIVRFVVCRTPGDAKRLGQRVELREDWEEIKIPTMLYLLQQKFSVEPLRSMLLATGDAELIEGNAWGDRFWGVSNGYGRNELGKLLMRVREELRQ
jgi:ribA/ribD-fused uncharacterized protein